MINEDKLRCGLDDILEGGKVFESFETIFNRFQSDSAYLGFVESMETVLSREFQDIGRSELRRDPPDGQLLSGAGAVEVDGVV